MSYINIHTHRIEHGFDIFEIINPEIKDKEYLDKLIENKHHYLSLGIHPWYIEENKIAEHAKTIKSLMDKQNILMIAECGIDTLCSTDI